jgi:hypothetical protein
MPGELEIPVVAEYGLNLDRFEFSSAFVVDARNIVFARAKSSYRVRFDEACLAGYKETLGQ